MPCLLDNDTKGRVVRELLSEDQVYEWEEGESGGTGYTFRCRRDFEGRGEDLGGQSPRVGWNERNDERNGIGVIGRGSESLYLIAGERRSLKEWKTKVVLIPKPGKEDISQPSSYRPTSLISVVGKFFA